MYKIHLFCNKIQNIPLIESSINNISMMSNHLELKFTLDTNLIAF